MSSGECEQQVVALARGSLLQSLVERNCMAERSLRMDHRFRAFLGQREANPMMVLNAARAAVLFFYGTLPMDDVVVESVDLIEVNHCYDEEGKHVFDQVLFYDWSAQDRQYHVRAWRMLKHPSQIPYRDTVSGRYEATWHDGWVMRSVQATTFRETWTQHDPEVAARSHLPKELRRELIRPVSTSRRIQ
jgi:hypothetical protein